jgi:hypothetical protein
VNALVGLLGQPVREGSMRTDKELLDDIRNAFRKAGWKEDMLGEFYLLGTVEETLYRYNRMETTLIGFVELVKCIQTNTMKANTQ